MKELTNKDAAEYFAMKAKLDPDAPAQVIVPVDGDISGYGSDLLTLQVSLIERISDTADKSLVMFPFTPNHVGELLVAGYIP